MSRTTVRVDVRTGGGAGPWLVLAAAVLAVVVVPVLLALLQVAAYVAAGAAAAGLVGGGAVYALRAPRRRAERQLFDAVRAQVDRGHRPVGPPVRAVATRLDRAVQR